MCYTGSQDMIVEVGSEEGVGGELSDDSEDGDEEIG